MFDDDDQFAMLNSPQEKFLAMLEAEAQSERGQELEAEGVQPWRTLSSYPAAEIALPPLPWPEPEHRLVIVEDVLELLPIPWPALHGPTPAPVSPAPDNTPSVEMSFNDSTEQPVQDVLDRWRRHMGRMADAAFGIPRKMMDFGGGDDTLASQQAMDEQRTRAKREFHAYIYGSFPASDPDSGSPALTRPGIDDEVADTLLTINRGSLEKNAAAPRQVMILKGRDEGKAGRAAARFVFDPRAYLAKEEGGDA